MDAYVKAIVDSERWLKPRLCLLSTYVTRAAEFA
jgi:hypothetical protein